MPIFSSCKLKFCPSISVLFYSLVQLYLYVANTSYRHLIHKNTENISAFNCPFVWKNFSKTDWIQKIMRTWVFNSTPIISIAGKSLNKWMWFFFYRIIIKVLQCLIFVYVFAYTLFFFSYSEKYWLNMNIYCLKYLWKRYKMLVYRDLQYMRKHIIFFACKIYRMVSILRACVCWQTRFNWQINN